ncbi:TetR family transcriptional regulator [Novosphingobium sp. PhB57]|uniref:TetR/AcrR family transcriptional regulator n=1 Tax=unclassified Novosphingobium TaxID=2644732 RepID=UPI0010EF2864|nr:MULTISPECIES: TetR/AcrR family transcriptional regulator [unclassified Novosphingobium]TCU58674.1 TetR family transcriptional regulator [Novosphingobium sp. PhB57]TDW61679.1 TetR family transcriptional regulator [Novosphingobium sp. PhB55]
MKDDTIMDRSRAARSVARREHLLDTARKLFVEQGFHRTGMAQIALASGIKVGQIYRDFENKEAIIAAICEINLLAWLEEDKLEAAVAARDTAAIRAWIERFCLDEPTLEDRRLMAELLAEVGRNPIIAAINQKTDDRVRLRLDEALESLLPGVSRERRSLVVDLIFLLSWGMMAMMELSPDKKHAPVRDHIVSVLRKELAALND